MTCCVLRKWKEVGNLSRLSLCRQLCTQVAKHEEINSLDSPRTNSDIRAMRNRMFLEEKKRQLSLIRRVEKIRVEYNGIPEDCTLQMNKELSTPYNCAMHMKSNIRTLAALALVNDEVWDMHRPLNADCSLEFLKFMDSDPAELNKACWRTGSFIIGYIFDRALKDENHVDVIRFPSNPVVEDGYFCCDIDLGSLNSWQPVKEELTALSIVGTKLIKESATFERLDVDQELALEMFKDNKHKCQQIPDIAKSSVTGSQVTLYKLLDYVDIASGPLLESTYHLFQFNITKLFPMTSSEYGPFVRVHGITMPRALHIHYKAYELLTERAKRIGLQDPYRKSSSIPE
ncbi:large ribosomal subunit protein mL39-like [Crassostrea virginica]|uniref:39S ribosomal protein L39, mitochondrial-like n=1 Tax=Crassostrea virginica TaxID=6565 RepID=A0A8B8DF78_CRAVI|nr:39S ribosomal protein L39, mitochondrial-like [Crassostrea virginica]